MVECYEMAGRVIEVTSMYDKVHRYCAEYRSDRTPDFSVEITQTDILEEREKFMKTAMAEGWTLWNCTDAYLEELAVYRKIAEKMPDYDTFLFHGSCIAVDGTAFLFTAKSGTGKSTHARLWRELLGERAVMVNDDKPLIRVEEGRILVFGTPYNGKHRLGTNMAAPLKAICLLERSEDNWIRPVSCADAFPVLFQQAYRPADTAAMAKSLALIQKMAERVGLYRLGVNMEPDAARMAYRRLSGEDGV